MYQVFRTGGSRFSLLSSSAWIHVFRGDTCGQFAKSILREIKRNVRDYRLELCHINSKINSLQLHNNTCFELFDLFPAAIHSRLNEEEKIYFRFFPTMEKLQNSFDISFRDREAVCSFLLYHLIIQMFKEDTPDDLFSLSWDFLWPIFSDVMSLIFVIFKCQDTRRRWKSGGAGEGDLMQLARAEIKNSTLIKFETVPIPKLYVEWITTKHRNTEMKPLRFPLARQISC